MKKRSRKIIIISFLLFFFSMDASYKEWVKKHKFFFENAYAEFSRNLFGEHNGSLRVPIDFSCFENIIFFHFKSARQEGGDCAWYSLSNALVMQSCVDAGERFTADKIEAASRSMVYHLKKKFPKKADGLVVGDIDEIARASGLKNYFIIDLEDKPSWMQICLPEGNREWSCYIDQTKYSNSFAIKSPLLFLKKVFSTSRIVHFCLSIPSDFGALSSHAVLVSIVQTGTKLPQVIYFDSNNRLLEDLRLRWVGPLALHKFLSTINEAFETL